MTNSLFSNIPFFTNKAKPASEIEAKAVPVVQTPAAAPAAAPAPATAPVAAPTVNPQAAARPAAPATAETQAPVRLSFGVKYVPLAFMIDNSGSTKEDLADNRRIYDAIVDALKDFLRSEDLRAMNRRILVSVYTFGGTVKRIVAPTPLYMLDPERVAGMIGKPNGLTPMGKALNVALDDLQGFRAANKQYDIMQPIVSLITDGKATDDMEGANERVDKLLTNTRADGTPKPLVQILPVGIGEDGEVFKYLERLIQKDPAGIEARVLHSEDDLAAYMRLVKATTIAAASSTFAGSGVMGNGSIFTAR